MLSGRVEFSVFGGLVEQLGSCIEPGGVDHLVAADSGETQKAEHVDAIQIIEANCGEDTDHHEPPWVSLLAEIGLSEPRSCL